MVFSFGVLVLCFSVGACSYDVFVFCSWLVFVNVVFRYGVCVIGFVWCFTNAMLVWCFMLCWCMVLLVYGVCV